MTEGAPERPKPAIHFGLPADDPLAARLFPTLPGEVKWGLDRTERMLAALGNPHRAYPILHVGGTNGKGSVARIWAGVLGAAGFRTGLYTSPHLVSFRERILVDGRPIADPLLEEWARDLRPLLVREAPSFFEAATVLAFLAFARAKVDVAVVEVGMGGRLDATNVVDPVLTAITNVGMDHAGMLGETLAAIAREKAGILKPGVPVFVAEDDREVLTVLAREAAQREALLRRVPNPKGNVELEGSRLRLRTARWGTLDLTSPLVGAHQLRNVALAVCSLEALPPRLPVAREAVVAGVRGTRSPGRFQVERMADGLQVLDVAHNLEGVRALARAIEAVDLPHPRVAVVGILTDKPVLDMLGELWKVVDCMVLTVPGTAPEARRWDPDEIARALNRPNIEVDRAVGSALERARHRAGASGTVVVTGSSYTVGEALVHLEKVPEEALPLPFYSE